MSFIWGRAARPGWLQEVGTPLLQAGGALAGFMLRGPTATNEPPLELCLVLVHEKELSQQDIGLGRRTCGRKMRLSESHSEVPALPPPSVLG